MTGKVLALKLLGKGKNEEMALQLFGYFIECLIHKIINE